jgi:predicted transcriptional regulator
MERLGRVQFGQRGFLRPQIVQLLEKRPMNGVDIMNDLQEMSHGWYRPSPGSIYPLLEQLEKEGLIAKNEDGKFELTASYREQSGIGGDVGSCLSVIESNTSYLEDLQRTDGASLPKYRDRIEKLAKRLEALAAALQSRGGP